MRVAGIEIGVCTEQDRRAALELVLRPLAPNQRGPLVESLRRVKFEQLGPFDALVAARQHGQIVAAVWAQPQPGRTAALWVPQVDGVRLDRVATPLIQEACQIADQAGVELSQVLLEQEADSVTPDLIACGFRKLTELQYLGWTPDPSALDTSQACELQFAPTTSVSRTQLEQIVGETYIDTLDCPELDGMRSIADVIGGYEQTGDHDPALWFVLRDSGVSVGVLLLSEHKLSQQMELIYMGVIPQARGKGFGQAAVAAAQAAAVRYAAERLVLAVDARNYPAREVYRRAGFQPWAQRVVYLRRRHEPRRA